MGKLCSITNCPASVALLAGLVGAITLATAERDILISVGDVNRSEPGAESVVGLFARGLPLRITVSGPVKLENIIESIIREYADSLRCADAPLADIWDKLPRRQDGMGGAQVYFIHTEAPRRRHQAETATWLKEVRRIPSVTADSDLTASTRFDGESIAASIKYYSEAFAVPTIDWIFELWERLLADPANV